MTPSINYFICKSDKSCCVISKKHVRRDMKSGITKLIVKKHARVGEMKGSREIYNDIWRTSCIVRTFVE